MKIQGKAADQIEKLVEQFRSENVTESITKVMITTGDIPAGKWSTMNRWISFVQTGDIDCRGFRQWEQAGRKVNKGEKAAYILRPITIKKEVEKEDGTTEEKVIVVGFGSIPVFGLSQTDGKPVDYELGPKELPELQDVANHFGLDIKYGPGSSCYGAYHYTEKVIMLCTHEEQTFFHELSHAAHHRVKGTMIGGQNPKQEIIAEFCACILARMYGRKSALEGNTYHYIESYARLINKSVADSILSFMGDIVKVLDLIINTKESLLAKAA